MRAACSLLVCQALVVQPLMYFSPAAIAQVCGGVPSAPPPPASMQDGAEGVAAPTPLSHSTDSSESQAPSEDTTRLLATSDAEDSLGDGARASGAPGGILSNGSDSSEPRVSASANLAARARFDTNAYFNGSLAASVASMFGDAADSFADYIAASLTPEGRRRLLDPIDVGDADKEHVQVDYLSQGASPLRLARVYHSNLATFGAQVTVPVGPGWRLSWDRSVQVVSGSQVRLHRPNGRAIDFTLVGGSWAAARPLGTLTATGGGWSYQNTRSEIETYGSNGRLTSLQVAGKLTTLQYDGAGRLWRVVNPFGRTLTFGYDAAGRVSSVALPDGNLLRYGYDGVARLRTVTFADNSVRQYLYESPTAAHLLTGVIDESGKRVLTWTYDGLARPSGGWYGNQVNAVSVAYSGNQAIVTDARGTVRTRSFATVAGRLMLTSVQTSATADSAATSWSFAYDANGSLIQTTARTGEVIQQSNDAFGRQTALTRGAGTAQAISGSTTWHPTWRHPTRIVHRGVTWDFTLDAAGRVTRLDRTPPGGVAATVRSFQYNAVGLLTAVTDAVSKTTTFGYDGNGHLTSVTDANGKITAYSLHNGHGQAGRIDLPDGRVLTKLFDSRGRATAVTVDGRTTAYQYDAAGRVTRETGPDGDWQDYAYTQAGHLATVVNHRAESVAIGRDVAGEVVSVSAYNAAGQLVQTSSRAFDAVGRLKTQTDSRGYATRMNYASDGRLASVVDASNRSFGRQVDLLGRVTATTQPNTAAMVPTQGATATIGHLYDNVNGNHTRTTDANGVQTQYGHDSLNRRRSEAGSDPGTTTVGHDNADRVVTSTNPLAQTTGTTYDALGRVSTVAPANTATLAFTYVANSPDGRLASMSYGGGSTSWTYDAHGRLLTQTQNAAGIARTLSITRDGAGRPTAVTYPSGMQVTYTYSQERIASIRVNGAVLLDTITYRPFSDLPASWRWGNGSTHSRGFDNDGRITSVTLGGGVTRSYSHDALGRVSGFNDNGAASSFTYDEAGQLSGYSGPQGSHGYAWDANGNRRSEVLNGTSRSYTYVAGSNKLSAISGGVRSYSYTSGGRVVSNGTGWSLYYDGLQRVKQARRPNMLQLNFTLDAWGRRVNTERQRWVTGPALRAGSSTAKTQDASAASSSGYWETMLNTSYVYDLQGRLLGEYDDDGPAPREFIWFMGQPVGTWQQGTLYHVHADHLDTPRAVTRASDGLQAWRWNSEPFGGTAATVDAGLQSAGFRFNLRFPGQILDPDTGLHYNWHRYYEPRSGRYLQADPIGLAGGVSRFAYVGGNPLSAIDPEGLETTVVTVFDTKFGLSFGTHSALHILRNGRAFLYDPGGGYNPRNARGEPYRGSGGFFEGSAASMSAYVRHHTSQGSTVKLVTLQTTALQERAIQGRAEQLGDTGPFTCTGSVASALGGVCGIVSEAFLPGTLYNSARGASCGP